ncbi:MAG: L-aspartate oxidase [Clostridium septicum]|uniref:L-aspartate oxidase n=1 Tax=uncultured Clostridium sp. TaxID=59620 RepID=UPI00290264D0|nr:L-aspartate oxidase [Clostridium septicum]MDU1314001.1 L-aspartate oxidase [Clostridium septicum]
MSTALNSNDIKSFQEDTILAGNFKNDPSAVKILTKESLYNIKNLINLGVKFDTYENNLHYTKEGGHKTNKIVHVKDQTGKAVMEILLKKVLSRKNITILENTNLIDIIKKSRCIGGLFLSNNIYFNIYSKFTILATGGIGGLFNSSTNVESSTGDGLAIAFTHDIELKDMEYLQLHPTVLYEKDKNGNKLLLSESLRGEGGKILNLKKEAFITPLLPRDTVSKAILKEIEKSNSKHYVYLDMRHLGKDFLNFRFPYIYNKCLEKGYSLDKQLIPISPAHHYCMGGIKVNKDSATSLLGLYAVGEVSCTGLHGSNRLASNSLLEALVFSRRCALNINSLINKITPLISNFSFNIEHKDITHDNFINFLKGKADNRYNELFIN